MARRYGFYDRWADLYDLMVDWKARLAREGPPLIELLRSAGAKRVLDVACGTGQHLRLLADAGFAVTGADSSIEMIARAFTALEGRRFTLAHWSMQSPPERLTSAGPFDAILCLGNSFPHLVSDEAVRAALANFRKLLAPGGLLVMGLKSLELLRQARRPFLPLVKRRHKGEGVLFVRFYDFDEAEAGPAADFHLVIIAPKSLRRGVHHAVTRLRAWTPDDLAKRVARARFKSVRVARDLAGTEWKPGDSEDIFVVAMKAR